MDPNANLAEQLDIVARIAAGTHTTQQALREGERLAELVDALHDWIEGGGFLPAAWVRK